MSASPANVTMYQKIIAVTLALALIGTGGTVVMAENSGSPVVADLSETEDLSPNTNELADGGSDDDGGGGGELESSLGLSGDLTNSINPELTPV